MRCLIFATGALLFVGSLSAQTVPTFEVASVKPNAVGMGGGEGSKRQKIDFAPGTLTMRNVNLTAAIRWAYRVLDFQISGPGWLGSQRFDIAAKAATPVPEDEARVMLQALLADRFKLELHRETKQQSVYALQQTKGGTKCKASVAEGEMTIQPTNGGKGLIRHAPVSQMVDMLSGVLGKVVLDETGLEGKYDCDPDFSSYQTERRGDAPPDMADVVGIIMLGLQEQFGLKLESKKAPVEFLIIDHMEKLPTEN